MRKRFGHKEVVVTKKLGCEEEVLLTRKIFLQQAKDQLCEEACMSHTADEEEECLKSFSWLWNMNMM